MMPVVRIPDPVFERLQAIAKPFVDTPADVIEKLLDFFESKQGKKRAVFGPSSSARQTASISRAFDPSSPPDLRHSRILAAEFDGQRASNWNNLVYLAHRRAMARLKSFESLRAATVSNIAGSKRTQAGFHYLADINLSVQNVDANLAFRNTLHLARRLKVPFTVEFEWREKSGAAHPGKSGSLSWRPDAGHEA